MKLSKLVFALMMLFASSTLFAKDGEKQITITINVTNCQGDSINIYQFDGIVFNRVKTLKSTAKEHLYKFTIAKGKQEFYFFGQNVQELRPIILGMEDNINIEGNCYAMRAWTVKNSKINPQYEGSMRRLGELINAGETANRGYLSAGNDPAKKQSAEQELSKADKNKAFFLDSLRKVNPFVAKIVAPGILYSYPISVKKYTTEQEYFAKEYFSQVDFKDEEYNILPTTFEVFKNYTNTIHSMSFTPQQQYDYVENWLSKFSKNSHAYKLALGGIVSSLMARNHINYITFGERYCKMYEKEESGITTQLQGLIDRSKTFIIGVEAPDFAQNTPDDKPLSLKSLRGKVVLVDFWASWCGPCRRENPNVIAVYNKYKDRGFDILSVSMDSDKSRWVDAIAQDGLLWKNHISDLKGWQNGVAQLYSVTSIPQTLLIDKDGKILARNLRGEQLGETLKGILGE